MGFRGGGQIDPPPSISWFSSTPAEIGLTNSYLKKTENTVNETKICSYPLKLTAYLRFYFNCYKTTKRLEKNGTCPAPASACIPACN